MKRCLFCHLSVIRLSSNWHLNTGLQSQAVSLATTLSRQTKTQLSRPLKLFVFFDCVQERERDRESHPQSESMVLVNSEPVNPAVASKMSLPPETSNREPRHWFVQVCVSMCVFQMEGRNGGDGGWHKPPITHKIINMCLLHFRYSASSKSSFLGCAVKYESLYG